MGIKRALKISAFALVVVLIVSAWFYSANIERLYTAITLYDEDKIADNFISMPQAFNATTLQPSSTPYSFPEAYAPFDDELAIAVDGHTESIQAFLRASRTTSLLVLHKGKIVYEYYGETGAKAQPHISFSVAKSFVSALVGIAYEQGLIADLEQPVTDYVPELIGTGYDLVPIKDILQMSSGVRFNEDYADFNSDINRFSRAIAFGRITLFTLVILVFGCTSNVNVNNDQPPSTLNEAVSRLLLTLPPKDLNTLKSGTEQDLYKYHHGFGTGLRNSWGLWSNSKLSNWFNDKGIHCSAQLFHKQ